MAFSNSWFVLEEKYRRVNYLQFKFYYCCRYLTFKLQEHTKICLCKVSIGTAWCYSLNLSTTKRIALHSPSPTLLLAMHSLSVLNTKSDIHLVS